MADKYRTRNKLVVGIRMDDPQLRDDARQSAKAAGYPDLSTATVAYWAWLARRAGAKPPHRPDTPAAVARQLGRQFRSAVAVLAETDPEEAGQILAEAGLPSDSG